ncbi:MAG: hypothetical protein EOP49_48435, partial [Sphingobacteriales bacterium]
MQAVNNRFMQRLLNNNMCDSWFINRSVGGAGLRFIMCCVLLTALPDAILCQSTGKSQADADSIAGGKYTFTKKILTDSLEDPWSIVYGPDNHLWITEAKGYRVLRMNTTNGHADTILDLNTMRRFPRYDTIAGEPGTKKPWPQGGLMGIALHPGLLAGKPYIYLAYLYQYDGANLPGNGQSLTDGEFYFKTRLERYLYDSSRKVLRNREVIADSLPGSNDHNGDRLVIADVADQPYLFYSIGDMG